MIDHIVLALLIQLIIRAILRNWWAGAASSIAWAVSREITQAEYRWIEHYGAHLRANMPWWAGSIPAFGNMRIHGSTGSCHRSS